MRTRDELIHATLSQIDWEYVLTTFKTLNLPWYEQKPLTKNDLINDVASLMNNAFDNEGVEIVTEYWVVLFIDYPEDPHIEVIFTPIVITLDSLADNKLVQRIEELKNRIDLHLELEEYERCSKYKKQLDKLEKKLENKIKK